MYDSAALTLRDTIVVVIHKVTGMVHYDFKSYFSEKNRIYYAFSMMIFLYAYYN